MKLKFFAAGLMVLVLARMYCGGVSEKNLVNTQEIELGNVSSIRIAYSWEKISLFESAGDRLVIKEYMSRDNPRYYATVSNSGGRVLVEKGRRPFGLGSGILFNTFNARVEVYLPASYTGDIAIKTSSGAMEAGGGYSCSEISIESSSGGILVNSLAAGLVRLKTSSGGIRGKAVTGDAVIQTNSGAIVFGDINGNVDAGTSSGAINLERVNGSVTAKTSSGGIKCAVTGKAGNISLASSSGGIELGLPEDFAFNFRSRTSSGGLSVPFADRLFSPLSDRNSTQGFVGGESGGGNFPEVDIQTNSGGIRVRWTR